MKKMMNQMNFLFPTVGRSFIILLLISVGILPTYAFFLLTRMYNNGVFCSQNFHLCNLQSSESAISYLSIIKYYFLYIYSKSVRESQWTATLFLGFEWNKTTIFMDAQKYIQNLDQDIINKLSSTCITVKIILKGWEK